MEQFNAVVCTGEVINDRTDLGKFRYAKYRKITSRERFVKFCNGAFPSWRFINWYQRKKSGSVYLSTQKRSII